MKCPSCRQPVDEPTARCPRCRVDLHKLDLRFGVAPKHSSYLTDSGRVLSHGDERKVKTLLHLFHRKFPQSTLSVLLAELPAGTSLSEYTFWLANRVRFGTVESMGKNNFDILLVIDTKGAAGLTVGYGLENYLPEEELRKALTTTEEAFAKRDWVAGIEQCANYLTKQMREISRGKR